MNPVLEGKCLKFVQKKEWNIGLNLESRHFLNVTTNEKQLEKIWIYYLIF